MTDADPRLRITINPAPTDEELAAIVSALVTIAARPRADGDDTSPKATRWERAGRRDAMRGLDRDPERF